MGTRLGRCEPSIRALIDDAMLRANNARSTTLSTQTSVSWKPNGGGDVRTWNEVMGVVDRVKSPVTIWMGTNADGPYVIPAGTSTYRMHDSILAGARFAQPPTVTANDGAVFSNLGTIRSAQLVVHPSSNPGCSLFDPPQPMSANALITALGGSIRNAGSVAAWQPPENIGAVTFLEASRGFSGLSTAPLIGFGVGGVALVFVQWCNTGGFELGDNLIAGDAAATILLVHDGSLPHPFPFFTVGFAGTLVNSPNGIPGGAGPTANRPQMGFTPVPVGCEYFDQGLAPARPIFWDGATWRNADGTGPV